MLIYLVLINAAGFLFKLTDKYRAKKDMWRIPENTLLGIALLGGSVGSLLGMQIFHHKTRKPKFSIGIPVMIVLQAAVYIYFFR